MKVVHSATTLKEYIAEHRQILKDLCIWKHLTEEEKTQFKACTTEVQVDNLMASFRRKYL